MDSVDPQLLLTAASSFQMSPTETSTKFIVPKMFSILPNLTKEGMQQNFRIEENMDENIAETSKRMEIMLGDNAAEPSSKNDIFMPLNVLTENDSSTEMAANPCINQSPLLIMASSPSSAVVENANQNDVLPNKKEGSQMSHGTLPAVIKPPGDEKEERPTLSYKDLIIEAIESSPERRLKLSEIYQVIKYLHPYYQRRADQWGWQNSIRHNLSLHDCFVKLPLKQTSANGVVGHFWTVVHRNPEEKQGPTRRRSRANINTVGSTKGASKKLAAQQQHCLGHHQNIGTTVAGGKAKGLKGRQSVSSDSGVMSDDGGMRAVDGGCHSGTISPLAIGGSASVPLPTLLQIPQNGQNKFQTLQSPLALSSHTPTTLQHFPFPAQSTQINHLLSPLELVLNAQDAANLVQSPQQPQSQIVQFSPIPGKTAPSNPQTSLLEQQLQQLLAANANNANFGQNTQMLAHPSSSPPQLPTTPASAPPTFLGANLSNNALMASLGRNGIGTPAANTNEASLSLLSQLASQLLASSTPSSAAVPSNGSPQFGTSSQIPQNNSLAIAAAALEMQRLQMLQIYAQQQQQQLEQQLALLEQSHHRDQLMSHFGSHHSSTSTTNAITTHSAPLSPNEHSSSMLDNQQNSSSILTQLLSKLLPNSSILADQLPIQVTNNQPSSLPIKTSPPPLAPSSTFGTQMEILMDQPQFGERTTENGREPSSADLMMLGPILLQQFQQRQQQREDANNANATQQLATAIVQQAVQQQQQIQQALVDNSEPELAVV